jgi:hypothetical protein
LSEVDQRLVRLIERQSRRYRAQLLCWYCSATKVNIRETTLILTLSNIGRYPAGWITVSRAFLVRLNIIASV